MTAALGITIGVLALAILAMAVRLSGLKADAVDADHKRLAAEKQLRETAQQLASHQERTKQQLADLRMDIAELEHDLEQCTTPGSRRARLERLLSKAADGANGGNSERLPH
jgi:TolA-binding protein